MTWRVVIVIAMCAIGCADPRTLGGVCTSDCGAMIHPPGILDPTSPNFHGTLLESLNWDFALCATCHGSDFRGGTSGVSCLSCHPAGPTACVTCHGNGPTSNAHPDHANSTLTTVTCAECHIVPTTWNQDGHILHNGVAITGPAKVTFGARAALGDPANRAGPPTWDGTTCTNVYCHGAVLGDAGGLATAPRWTDPTPDGTCDRCHGNPPPSHVRNECAECHPPSKPHINGIIEVGRVPGCSGCHGSPSSSAPPVDLEGNTFTTAIGVGAHQAHLQAPSRISGPIPCATCHVVPTTVDSPGHIDHTGPAIVTASLGWDHAAQTCSTSYCHGAALPTWTSTGEVYCGSCHGIPPSDAPHLPTMTLTSCASCHPGVVDAFGNIIINADGTSEHIDVMGPQ